MKKKYFIYSVLLTFPVSYAAYLPGSSPLPVEDEAPSPLPLDAGTPSSAPVVSSIPKYYRKVELTQEDLDKAFHLCRKASNIWLFFPDPISDIDLTRIARTFPKSLERMTLVVDPQKINVSEHFLKQIRKYNLKYLSLPTAGLGDRSLAPFCLPSLNLEILEDNLPRHLPRTLTHLTLEGDWLPKAHKIRNALSRLSHLKTLELSFLRGLEDLDVSALKRAPSGLKVLKVCSKAIALSPEAEDKALSFALSHTRPLEVYLELLLNSLNFQKVASYLKGNNLFFKKLHLSSFDFEPEEIEEASPDVKHMASPFQESGPRVEGFFSRPEEDERPDLRQMLDLAQEGVGDVPSYFETDPINFKPKRPHGPPTALHRILSKVESLSLSSSEGLLKSFQGAEEFPNLPLQSLTLTVNAFDPISPQTADPGETRGLFSIFRLQTLKRLSLSGGYFSSLLQSSEAASGFRIDLPNLTSLSLDIMDPEEMKYPEEFEELLSAFFTQSSPLTSFTLINPSVRFADDKIPQNPSLRQQKVLEALASERLEEKALKTLLPACDSLQELEMQGTFSKNTLEEFLRNQGEQGAFSNPTLKKICFKNISFLDQDEVACPYNSKEFLSHFASKDLKEETEALPEDEAYEILRKTLNIPDRLEICVLREIENPFF